MERVTVEGLKKISACDSAIGFVERNNLEGFPIELLDQVEGDYNSYISWLKNSLKNRWEYDSHGNMVKRIYPDGDEYRLEYDAHGNEIKIIFPDGDEHRWEYDSHGNMINVTWPDSKEYLCPTSFYDDGQLKSINKLELPWFEKGAV